MSCPVMVCRHAPVSLGLPGERKHQAHGSGRPDTSSTSDAWGRTAALAPTRAYLSCSR